MSRKAIVKVNNETAGYLEEVSREKYIFMYDTKYLLDENKPAVSITLPKTEREYKSEALFPFFASLIAEGSNLSLQSRYLKIDEQDNFGILLKTAAYDTIGNVTIEDISK